MSRAALLGMFAFVVAGLSGCASPAHVIRKDPTSVVVAVPDDTNTWPFYYRDEATRTAAEFIQDPELKSIQRVKVGEQMVNTQDMTRRDLTGKKEKPLGEVTTSTNTTSVSDKYEFQLAYVSRTAGRVPNTFINNTGRTAIPAGDSVTPAGGLLSPGNDAGIKPPPAPYTPATTMPTTILPGSR
jgi:hypothetical protein